MKWKSSCSLYQSVQLSLQQQDKRSRYDQSTLSVPVRLKLSLPLSVSVWKGLSLLLPASGLYCQAADYCTPPPCVKAAGWGIKSKLTGTILLLKPSASASPTRQTPAVLFSGIEASIPPWTVSALPWTPACPCALALKTEMLAGEFLFTDSELPERLSSGRTSSSHGARAPNSVWAPNYRRKTTVEQRSYGSPSWSKPEESNINVDEEFSISVFYCQT